MKYKVRIYVKRPYYPYLGRAVGAMIDFEDGITMGWYDEDERYMTLTIESPNEEFIVKKISRYLNPNVLEKIQIKDAKLNKTSDRYNNWSMEKVKEVAEFFEVAGQL